ncbi:HTTM domain-containing protein [Phytoactinopolyspora halotolerans]|uniref:HTTM domain-containing protein n=1 Tax=Phytoactinopolyspora halotolerans TaxID=1981512 RepID=A0A6L9SCG6_9ACTN|nr:HTTM domain-containing protein [Phytoactinopolyspora halotolerans]NEE02763.1 HTTM domain-containing protein [Phytoactinopolyspora halotolerans]
MAVGTELRAAATWREAAARPVNGASAAFFRIAFGIAMLVNVLLYLPTLVHEYYVDTSFHFSYAWFDFIKPLPGFGIHAVYVVQGLLAILIALGLWYRRAVAGFFVLHTYVVLIDSTYFQNHEYLISLVSFLMIFMPLERRWSLDAWRRPDLASSTIPAWVVWLIRFQFGIVYFYGGVAKLNSDWLQGEPLRMWLHARTDIPIIGPLFEHEPIVLFMTYGSLIFDLAITFLLLHRRTQVPAFLVACCFHLLNVRLFGLFVFPWLMIAASTIYFRPDWPERVWAWVVALRAAAPVARARARVQRVAAGRGRVGDGDSTSTLRAEGGPQPRISSTLATFLAVWAAVQILVPLRHVLIPGSPNWTEEGHRFSWHMKLRDKQGTGVFYVTENGATWRVEASEHLNALQEFRLYGHPERLVRFAHYLSDQHDGAEVRAVTSVSLNGRAPAPIVDPKIDLASAQLVWWGHADWIRPLDTPLP